MSKIKFDKHNYRIHDDDNKELIKSSINELGAGRSIIVDSENEIIGGNGVYGQWGDRPIKVIETDGSELVVVKRTDLKTSDPKRRKLAIMDNSTSDNSHFDMELLEADFPEDELSLMGIDLYDDDSKEENVIFKKQSSKMIDKSNDISIQYKIELSFDSEESQQKAYNNLISEGYECHILTL